MTDLTAFALATILLAVLGGLWHGTRHHASKFTGEKAMRLNRIWHRLLFVEQLVLATALAYFAFGPTWAGAAAVTMFASWRWLIFDTSHAVADEQEPLYAGSVADSDLLLARIPVAARLALYLTLAIVSATLLHHAVTS